jgi:flagellar hook-associated protein 3 FlgL
MRVTQQMLSNNMLNNLRSNLSRMEKVQEQLSTGKTINRPSDDPVGLSYSMRYRSDLAANEQYQRNLNSANSWLEFGDTTVGQSVDVLQRARELAVQGANGTNPEQAREAIAAEVDQLFEQLREVANSKFNGKHVFNGQRTNQPPYEEENSYLSASFDTGKISFEVSRGVTVGVNLHAGEIFGEAGAEDNAFAALELLSSSLQSGDQDGIGQALGQLDSRLDQVLESWADLGARKNRVELIDNRLKDANTNIQSLLSKTEDANMAVVITNLKTEENVYQASLSAGARIIRPSLVDFLR